MLSLKPILNVVGVMLLACGILMFTSIPFALYYQTGNALPIFNAGIITVGVGVLCRYYKYKEKTDVMKKEGYMTVALGWLAMIMFGTLPYLFTGEIPNFGNAVFEVASGVTTTGSTILTDIEAMTKDMLYWRSLTQWIGGMGVIVLTVAVFPYLGLGGVDLFSAEAPGPTSDKIHPRIQETAKVLWLLYVSITFILFILLWVTGMSFYNAVNHALTTMATGGFSPENDSIASFPAHIQYIITVFMFVAGTNYLTIYLALNGKLRRVLQSDEFKFYATVIGILILVYSFSIYSLGEHSMEKSFRDSAFQVVSLVTTTGYATADYTQWMPFLTFLSFILLFVGGSAGSTAGGMKMIRHLVLFKNIRKEFKLLLHPRAIIPSRVTGAVVPTRIIMNIQVFILLYIMIFVLTTLALMAMGIDMVTSLGAAATSIGNVGPAIGDVGPVDNFAWLPMQAKMLLSFIMVIGRLEIFTILVLFTPSFWKKT